MVNIGIFIALFVATCHAISQEEIDQFYNVVIRDRQNDYLVISDGIPVHEVGDFPNPDNPNDIEAQDFSFRLFKNPTPADISCLPPGPIGITKEGVALFNAYDNRGRDAVIFEVFDDCHGHPDARGVYHYHQDPKCLHAEEPGHFIGAAFDGYPIYGYMDEDGSEITPDDLDFCGGRFVNGEYRYHVTLDFPYMLGCFSGEVPQFIKNKQDGPDCRFAFPDKARQADIMNHSAASEFKVTMSSLMAVVMFSLVL